MSLQKVWLRIFLPCLSHLLYETKSLRIQGRDLSTQCLLGRAHAKSWELWSAGWRCIEAVRGDFSCYHCRAVLKIWNSGMEGCISAQASQWVKTRSDTAPSVLQPVSHHAVVLPVCTHLSPWPDSISSSPSFPLPRPRLAQGEIVRIFNLGLYACNISCDSLYATLLSCKIDAGSVVISPDWVQESCSLLLIQPDLHQGTPITWGIWLGYYESMRTCFTFIPLGSSHIEQHKAAALFLH